METAAYVTLLSSPDPSPVRVYGPDFSIGRAPHNDLVLRDAFVQRRHLALFWRDGAWWVVSFAGANPVYVDGQIVERERRLSGGEELLVGESRMRFTLADAEGA